MQAMQPKQNQAKGAHGDRGGGQMATLVKGFARRSWIYHELQLLSMAFPSFGNRVCYNFFHKPSSQIEHPWAFYLAPQLKSQEGRWSMWRGFFIWGEGLLFG